MANLHSKQQNIQIFVRPWCSITCQSIQSFQPNSISAEQPDRLQETGQISIKSTPILTVACVIHTACCIKRRRRFSRDAAEGQQKKPATTKESSIRRPPCFSWRSTCWRLTIQPGGVIQRNQKGETNRCAARRPGSRLRSSCLPSQGAAESWQHLLLQFRSTGAPHSAV